MLSIRHPETGRVRKPVVLGVAVGAAAVLTSCSVGRSSGGGSKDAGSKSCELITSKGDPVSSPLPVGNATVIYNTHRHTLKENTKSPASIDLDGETGARVLRITHMATLDHLATMARHRNHIPGARIVLQEADKTIFGLTVGCESQLTYATDPNTHKLTGAASIVLPPVAEQ